MALFILGAGATRGCSFVNSCEKACIPPLDGDFFTQLQRVENPKHQALIREVLADVVTVFGLNFDTTLEMMFATLEHTIRMLKTTGDNRDFRRPDLVEMRTRLLQAIAVCLEESLCEQRPGGGSSRTLRQCQSHELLVESTLRRSDDIISFNYDCTIDEALKNKGNGKWNPRYGYGFDLGPRGRKLFGDQFWMPSAPAVKERTIHLYKLHGSLHFQVQERKERLFLKQRPYTKQTGNLKFSIIAPESNKAYDQGIFAGLWQKAAGAIKKAKHIVVIGYSLPLTDLHSTALLRTSVSKGKLKSLVVINPDRSARKRTRDVLQRGLAKETRVLSFDQIKEFLAADQKTWRV